MVVGLGVFAGSYLFSVVVGATLRSLDSSGSLTCVNCHFGNRLFVPIAGPWWLLPEANGAGSKALVATMGVLQAAGLALSIWGIVKFVSTGPSSESATSSERLAFSLTPLRDGAYASFGTRW